MIQPSLFANTPDVIVFCNRRHPVRDLGWYRHPCSPGATDVRATRHARDPRGLLSQSADPRLYDSGQVSVTRQHDLAGRPLRTASADAGTTLSLTDAAGRQFLMVTSQRDCRTWRYEDAEMPGRLLAIAEQAAGETECIAERLEYADRSAGPRAVNLAGACVCHWDPAGLLQTKGVALTGVATRVTRRLLQEAADPNVVADWPEKGAADRLAAEVFTTLTVPDATGAEVSATVAGGHVRLKRYDVAGRPAGCAVRVRGEAELVTVKSVTYAAGGQTLDEVHGSGVVTRNAYEARTQRPSGIRTMRPSGHMRRALLLQDIQWLYDPAGNVVRVSNGAEAVRFWRNRRVLPESRYVYDTLYQLVSATGREMADGGMQDNDLSAAALLRDGSGAYTNYIRNYAYDRGGNLVQIRHSAPATGNSYTTDFVISDVSNRGVLSTLGSGGPEAQFTAGGQQRQLQPGQRLCWTARGELRQVTPVERDGDGADREYYRYDAKGLRVLKVSVQKTREGSQARRVVYLSGGEYRDACCGGASQLTVVEAAGGAGAVRAELLLDRETGGVWLRYGHDGLTGSTGLEVDGEGSLLSCEEYYPYGGTAVWAMRSQGEVNGKTVRYSGRERDATGLYYYGHRYYQPWAGRWLSADPAGTADGLNLYAMCGNNPVTCRDDGGLMGFNPHHGLTEQSSVLDDTRSESVEAATGLSATGLSPGQRYIDLLAAVYSSENNGPPRDRESGSAQSGSVTHDLDRRIYSNPAMVDKLTLFRSNATHRTPDDYTVASVDGHNAFVNIYKPHEWIFESNFRVEDRGYYASHVAAVQYEMVSRARGFFGQLPSRLIRKGVANEITLTVMDAAVSDNLPLKDIFLEKTPNGRSTRRIAGLFGLEITQVSRPCYNDFYVDVKMPAVTAQSVSSPAPASEKRGRFSVMRSTYPA